MDGMLRRALISGSFRRLCRLWLVAAAIGSPVFADAVPPNGTIPYGAVAGLLDGFVAITNRDKLRLVVRVVPAGKQPPAKPISLQIQGAHGIVPLRVAPDGALLEFPLTVPLHTENPPIVSNQPKGSLRLRADLLVRFPGRLAEDASWYADALAQVNAAAKSQAGHLSFAFSRVDTLVFSFDPPSPASVTVRTSKGESVSKADPEGTVRIKLPSGEALKAAQVILSAEPKSITAE